ncbi:MAG TPA: class I adenylate-forming enzyme family protein [Acidimicrobiales bacterium]|jgi:long-chain acyl-CoA synthetase|nr:class I adenylate-forming enzyme family protein [Acidimicrobiales bacterium]
MTLSIAEADAQLTAPGQMFEIDEVNIRGVRTRVWKNCPATLADLLNASKGHGDKTFIVYEDDKLSFDEHFRRSAQLAHILRDRFGVREGDRVAIAMRNYPEWSIAFWGATAAGAVVVPLNSWWTGEELQYGLEDSGTKVLLADVERAASVAPHRDRLPDLVATIVARSGAKAVPEGDLTWESVLAEEPPADIALPAISVSTDDDATIFYTSGTTGRPKGALGTHRNICTNPMSLFFVNMRSMLRSGTEPSAPGAGDQNAYLLSVPLFHATGCHSILVTNLLVGGKLVMMHRWDAGRALELIERERITTFGGVPTMVLQVLDHPDFPQRDTSSVKSVGYGGAPAPPELVKRIQEHFNSSPASNGYGLTETSSLSTMNSGADYLAKPDSVGPPVPIVSVKVVDPDGHEMPTGDVGELWIKGPNVVKGYWNKPDATASVFTDGWLHTGDVARLDDEGFVYIVDRAKDMLIRGGENVYCVEIEGVLYEHPAVAEAAVIGIPHPTLGEEVGAVITLLPGTSASESELQEFVRTRLAAFKVPVKVWFYDSELPRNPAGKVLKRDLREQLVEP